jgi:hypothetical protein
MAQRASIVLFAQVVKEKVFYLFQSRRREKMAVLDGKKLMNLPAWKKIGPYGRLLVWAIATFTDKEGFGSPGEEVLMAHMGTASHDTFTSSRKEIEKEQLVQLTKKREICLSPQGKKYPRLFIEYQLDKELLWQVHLADSPEIDTGWRFRKTELPENSDNSAQSGESACRKSDCRKSDCRKSDPQKRRCISLDVKNFNDSPKVESVESLKETGKQLNQGDTPKVVPLKKHYPNLVAKEEEFAPPPNLPAGPPPQIRDLDPEKAVELERETYFFEDCEDFDSFTNRSFGSMLETFFNAYEKHEGKPHPNVSQEDLEKWKEVISGMDAEKSSVENFVTEFPWIVKNWFKNPGIKTDFKAYHFFTEGILKNRYWEAYEDYQNYGDLEGGEENEAK